MPVSALTLLNRSYSDLNILGKGESLDAEDAQDGLARLNAMLSGWRTQYGTVTAIERMVFPIVANKQTYTIGLGGDFNVPRPESIDGAGLWLAALSSALSVTSITRSGYTATVTQAAHPFAVGDEAFIQGATQPEYNGLQTVETVIGVNSYTFTLDGAPTTPAVGTLTAAAITGTPTEIPRQVLTDDGYQSIQLKNMSNSQFTDVYYNATYPYGTIFLWPRPNTAANQLVLYLKNVFTGFADLTTVYDFPSVPGYEEAIQYQFDLRIAAPNGRDIPPLIGALAVKALALIKRANNKINDLPNDASRIFGDRRAGYNIVSGNY
jgi:hypothetical protein